MSNCEPQPIQNKQPTNRNTTCNFHQMKFLWSAKDQILPLPLAPPPLWPPISPPLKLGVVGTTEVAGQQLVGCCVAKGSVMRIRACGLIRFESTSRRVSGYTRSGSAAVRILWRIILIACWRCQRDTLDDGSFDAGGCGLDKGSDESER